MLLLWTVSYLDSRDRKFKERHLWLDTSALDPVTQAAVELCNTQDSSIRRRLWPQYRRLFREWDRPESELKALMEDFHQVRSFSLHDYCEDEHGKELSTQQRAKIVTGSPDSIMVPAGTPRYHMDYLLSERRPILIDQVSLAADDIRILGYFCRDLRELASSAFFADGPGVLHHRGNAPPELQTAATDEEIRSFITIFRRLYMTEEPAGFLKAVDVFARATDQYALGRWVEGAGAEYQRQLQEKPHGMLFVRPDNVSFSTKQLINVYLYTRYAHQPNAKKERQYRQYLAEVGGDQALLLWMFFSVIWQCSHMIQSAGEIMAGFFDQYCKHHELACDVLMSVAHENPGIGRLEKQVDREQRLFDEAVALLADRLWSDAGRPEGGAARFEAQARAELNAALKRK